MPAQQVVLLIHGMGTHAKGNIKKEFIQGLKDGAALYGIDNYDISADSKKIVIEEFNYSELLDEIREKLSEASQTGNFEQLQGVELGGKLMIVDKLLEFEGNVNNEEFVYTHLLDVVLYSMTHFGSMVRVKLAKKIEELRNPVGDDGQPVHVNLHIVCHSLGTAVVHDTLAQLYRPDAVFDDDIPDLSPGEQNIKSLWTVSNVSKLIQGFFIFVHGDNPGLDPDNSVVVSQADPVGCVDTFNIVRHGFDPFLWITNYDRDQLSGKSYYNNIIHKLKRKDANGNDIELVDPHDFQEYLTEPEVARKMIRTFDKSSEGQSIPKAKIAEAKEKFSENSLNSEHQNLKNKFDAIKLQNPASIEDFVETAKKFRKALKEFNDVVDA